MTSFINIDPPLMKTHIQALISIEPLIVEPFIMLVLTQLLLYVFKFGINKIWGDLRNLVLFVQFKKAWKTHIVSFAKSKIPTWVFFLAFEIFKWYQIKQSISYCIVINKLINWMALFIITKFQPWVPFSNRIYMSIKFRVLKHFRMIQK